MNRPYISLASRQRIAVWAEHRCSYCQAQIDVVGSMLEIDHIIPLHVGGTSAEINLCLACSNCNQAKGTKTHTLDSISAKLTPLFNPRTQKWHDHFHWSEDGTLVIGITSTGRVTVTALNMNHEHAVKARRRWVSAGWHPPRGERVGGR